MDEEWKRKVGRMKVEGREGGREEGVCLRT